MVRVCSVLPLFCAVGALAGCAVTTHPARILSLDGGGIRGLLMMAWGAKGGALTAAACLVGGPCL